MATYGGAVDLVLTDLGRSDGSITAVVEREILKAIEHYAPERFWFNEARASFTASNTILYSLETVFPATSTYMAGFVEIDQVSVVISGAVSELEVNTHQELQREDVSGTTGPPSDYAIFAEQLRIYPKPPSGTTYQIDVFGTRRLATLSASTESNAWTNAGLDLICARVGRQICARKFKDYDAAQAYKMVEDDEYQRLQDRTTRYLSTGKLKGGW